MTINILLFCLLLSMSHQTLTYRCREIDDCRYSIYGVRRLSDSLLSPAAEFIVVITLNSS